MDAAIRSAGLGEPTLCLGGGAASDSDVHHAGPEGMREFIATCGADVLLNAAAGAAGLAISMAALEAGMDVALANKETIVMAGRLALEAAASAGRRILPVDSEHWAIFRMVSGLGRDKVKSAIITASGGAFRALPLERLGSVTLAEALAHPTWSMGPKITIDSASMANKGLEVIEAARLFSFSPEEISVVIHPESLAHSFVRTVDGSLYAQLSKPDMRIPILGALAWPDAVSEDLADMDPALSPMSFRRPEAERYPLLGLAYGALHSGEGATAAYNAANEVAVAAFVDGNIRFVDIAAIVAEALSAEYPARLDDLDSVMDADASARRAAIDAVGRIA